MNDDPSPSRLRGAPRWLARAAALSVSVGVLVLLMVRASGGCRGAEATVVAEATSAPPPAASALPGASVKPRYFPGTKAPAGHWAVDEPEEPSAKPAAAASARPRYFPGTKSMPDIVEPDR
jgi:hypothetical protein